MTTPLSRRVLLALVLCLTAASCTIKDERTPLPPTAPTPTPKPEPKPDVIEFRVSGNVQTVAVRTSDTFNGQQFVTTSLPYFTQVQSLRDTLFLSVDAQTLVANSSTLFGNYVQVQILVNGVLFKEASDIATLPHATASGTWRR